VLCYKYGRRVTCHPPVSSPRENFKSVSSWRGGIQSRQGLVGISFLEAGLARLRLAGEGSWVAIEGSVAGVRGVAKEAGGLRFLGVADIGAEGSSSFFADSTMRMKYITNAKVRQRAYM
jgi:hypothetical protein